MKKTVGRKSRETLPLMFKSSLYNVHGSTPICALGATGLNLDTLPNTWNLNSSTIGLHLKLSDKKYLFTILYF